ncbi:poly-gamma-glutamate hydrolase family protein [Streptomyces sp. TBY4]|uniref:poly-gamma-glutamate hydrolase family protein n=1 Tax=Streptomyces sp. TBY4 TaxID=2962030 RepID=UPI0020B7F0DA|nr:poly-gamma-glutamate hydrolase family protein [Streptomyces sp. TBY4]MCP3758221.1 poly-gamma-glutamate hydrolase family protein [Streptomyces sp. TBY4]
MGDLYDNWAELSAAETEGVDFTRTSIIPTGATYAAIAIHGGGIEAGSSELAYEVSGGGTTMALFDFKGLKTSGNQDLHLTSTHFDEPNAVALVAASSRTLSFHGYTGVSGFATTALGGLDEELGARVAYGLRAAGFEVTNAPSEIAGDNPDNICNKNLRLAGVQLELSRQQRADFFPNGDLSRAMRDSGQRTEAFYRYATAVQNAVIGYGMVSLTSINVSRYTTIDSPGANVDLLATVATDKLAAGGGQFCALAARWTDASNMYLARIEFSAAQTVLLTLRKRVAGTETSLAGTHTTGYTHAPGRRFWCRFEVAGTTLRARVWPDGDEEPYAWHLTATDTDLTADGQIGTRSILSITNTNTLPVAVAWGDFQVPSPQRMTVTRSTNGIVKAHSAGAKLRLAQPAITAL